MAKSHYQDSKPPHSQWSVEAYELDLTGTAKQVAINSLQTSFENGLITLMVNQSVQPMMNDKLKQDVTDALAKYYNQTLKVTLDFAQQLDGETPAEYQQRMDDEAKAKFIDDLKSSEFGIAMKQNFNAVLLEHSVKKLN